MKKSEGNILGIACMRVATRCVYKTVAAIAASQSSAWDGFLAHD